jgi:hypothetical protein
VTRIGVTESDKNGSITAHALSSIGPGMDASALRPVTRRFAPGEHRASRPRARAN